MRLIGRERLRPLMAKSEQMQRWVRSWTSEVQDAHWKGHADVLAQFPRAQCTPSGSARFPLPTDDHAGISVCLAFAQGVALIFAVEL